MTRSFLIHSCQAHILLIKFVTFPPCETKVSSVIDLWFHQFLRHKSNILDEISAIFVIQLISYQVPVRARLSKWVRCCEMRWCHSIILLEVPPRMDHGRRVFPRINSSIVVSDIRQCSVFYRYLWGVPFKTSDHLITPVASLLYGIAPSCFTAVSFKCQSNTVLLRGAWKDWMKVWCSGY